MTIGDNGSRELLEKMLLDEEHHIDWLEGQLHAIKEMTYENYLAQQLHKPEESEESSPSYIVISAVSTIRDFLARTQSNTA
jgi:hypothetical protein